MVPDALAPCIAMTLAAMVSIVKDMQIPVSSSGINSYYSCHVCLEKMVENANTCIFLCFLKYIKKDHGFKKK